MKGQGTGGGKNGTSSETLNLVPSREILTFMNV